MSRSESADMADLANYARRVTTMRNKSNRWKTQGTYESLIPEQLEGYIPEMISGFTHDNVTADYTIRKNRLILRFTRS